MPGKEFTAGEVAALVEGLRGEFRVVAGVVVPLREDVAELKERFGSLETEVRAMGDGMRVAFPDLVRRVAKLESLKH